MNFVKPDLFTRQFTLLVILLVLVLLNKSATAQSTAFTYQGRLQDGGSAANGNYDLQFSLWDAVNGGIQQPQPSAVVLTRNAVTVANGIFTVQLDFSVSAFPGADRFLEIGVRPSGGGAFTILSPRQQISSSPYAIRTLTATAADSLSSACVACVQDSQINSVAGTKVSGPISVSSLPAGNNNYIQNATVPQSANFNISGNGIVGGDFTTNGNEALLYPNAGNGSLRIRNRASTNFSQVVFHDSGGTYRGYTGYIGPFAGFGSRNDTFELGSNGRDITIRPNEIETMRFSTSGNVGIGNSAPTFGLDVERAIGNTTAKFGATFGLYTVANFPSLGFNAYFSGAWRFGKGSTNHFGGLIDVNPLDGAMHFYTTNSGAADATAAVSERVRVTQAGNVGIGTTNPAARLSAVIEGAGVGVLGETSSGVGVKGQAADPFVGIGGQFINTGGAGGVAIRADGNAVQTLEHGGWVKAMAYVTPTEIVRCYNSQAATPNFRVLPNCGLSLIASSQGSYQIAFPFDVSDRFILVTASRGDPNSDAIASLAGVFGQTTAWVRTFDPQNGKLTDSAFYIFVF